MNDYSDYHSEAFREISRRMKEFLESSVNKAIAEVVELDKAMEDLSNVTSLSHEKMTDLQETLENLSSYEPESIEDIKKRIKYCKNPLELKQLNQKLNTLYKEQKRRR